VWFFGGSVVSVGDWCDWVPSLEHNWSLDVPTVIVPYESPGWFLEDDDVKVLDVVV